MPLMLLFLHGWGFDATCWRRLAALLPEWPVQLDDRGYFGTPVPAETVGDCIVVAHSFGAMRALADPPAGCRGLIAMNGFDRFVARAGGSGGSGVSPRIVDRMIAKFERNPAAVLADFRRRCGDDAPFGPVDIAPLRTDLLALRGDDRTRESAAWRLPILSLQGLDDPLLPAPIRDTVFAGAPLLERITRRGGHLLPATDPAYCARTIAAFAERAA